MGYYSSVVPESYRDSSHIRPFVNRERVSALYDLPVHKWSFFYAQEGRMTVKELSEFTGKTERAVQNWVKKASEKSSLVNEKSSFSTSTYPADYDVDEVEVILNESRLGQNAVMIIMENARREKHKEIAPDITGPLVAFMAQMQKQQEVFMTAVLDRLDKNVGEVVKPKQLPAPKKTDRAYLNQLVHKYAVTKLDNDHRAAWHILYAELYYRCRVSIPTRAKNAGISKADMIEELDLIEASCAILVEMMGE